MVGSWHAVCIVCILDSEKLISEPYLTSGTLKNGATEPITQGLVRPCTLLHLEINVRLRELTISSTWNHGFLHCVTEEFLPRSDDRLSCFAAFLAHDFSLPLRNVCPNSNHNCGLWWRADDASVTRSPSDIFFAIPPRCNLFRTLMPPSRGPARMMSTTFSSFSIPCCKGRYVPSFPPFR